MLDPRTMPAVRLYLDRLQELGVQGVTIPIGYPLYTPDFPRYQEYVQFYKQVAHEVRIRGMTLAVESSALFANTEFSTLHVDYSGLTLEKFEKERKQMITAIIQDVSPDYLNLGAEPDTQVQLLGLRELGNPVKYTEYVNYILNGLDRRSTKIGAGIGTWGKLEYAKSLAANTTLDSIHIHVYPIYRDFLQKILTISEIAHQHGKHVVMDEAWLLKSERPSGEGSVAASPENFRRDAFSFWAPLDQKFLEIITKSAGLAQIDYISPFWTQFFFAYLNYDSRNANLPFGQVSSLANRAAASNLSADTFSSTGEFYGQLATGITTPLESSASTENTATNSSDERLLFLDIAVIVIAVAAVLVFFAVLWLRRPKSSLG